MADRLHVLVVDDDDDVRETLGMVLASEGIDVALAANGLEAIDLLMSRGFGDEHPRVMLLDLRMPVMNGWQVLDALRRRPEFASFPVVLSTSSPEFAPEGMPLVVKPVDLDELLAILGAVAA